MAVLQYCMTSPNPIPILSDLHWVLGQSSEIVLYEGTLDQGPVTRDWPEIVRDIDKFPCLNPAQNNTSLIALCCILIIPYSHTGNIYLAVFRISSLIFFI